MSRCRLLLVIGLIAITGRPQPVPAAAPLIDLSLLVAEDYPCTWPSGFPMFQLKHYRTIGSLTPYNIDVLTIDGNTGTQIDVPPHSIPRQGSGLANEGPLGAIFIDKVPAWQYGGEAVVIDVTQLLNTTPNGVSSLIMPRHVLEWEKTHRKLRFGDVVLFRSGYTDKYYKPFPAGRRFVAAPVEGTVPAWPDPHPDTMTLLGRRGVQQVGCDSPSMGPLPTLGEPTHLAGLKFGMIFTESVTRLDRVKPGSFYCVLGPRHANGMYGEGRAFAVPPGKLASRLIDSARNKRAVELSVVLDSQLPVTWTGPGIGNHRHPYIKADFLYARNLDLQHHTHMMDAQAGTHLVPPSYALPPKGFNNSSYSKQVRGWLKEYERDFGKRGTSSLTTEQVPLDQTCGEARVIDVRSLVGTTDKATWPASPRVTVKLVKAFEAARGPLKKGQVVLFHTGHVDRTFQPLPGGSICISDPLNGTTEGWPAVPAAVIDYLASKGIGCVGSDTPSLGGVDEQQAVSTYWALGSRGMVAVEFLHNLDKLPRNAYFLFAPIPIRGCHGGPGRAIALY
ncbi:MAG: cyclase family protein [Planctomycetaceae bacterium]|nr:cyclase family protein [Planctomycetaceae bacterium]